MPTRVLVIALDAFEKDLLLQWTASGVLPHLENLLRRGTWGMTEPPAAIYGGAVWPSFNTGTNPGHHRRFFRRQARHGEYLDVAFTPDDIEGVPFWEILSRAGRRVAVLDVPHSRVASQLNGMQVVDWATHEPELEQAQTCPAPLRQEILSRFGAEPPDQCEEVQPSADSHRRLLAHLEARLRNKTAMSRHYLRCEGWDFFIAAFHEAHCAGHQWWHLHDPTHPAHSPALAAATGDLLQATYVAIDQAVGEIAAEVSSDTLLLVLCSHGMGPLYGESVVLDEVLRRLEPPPVRTGSVFQMMKSAWYALPPAVRGSPLARHLRVRMQQPLHRSLLVPDRQARRFFAIPHNPHGGAIRINLAGRETRGVVQPGEEYRRLCAELRQELLALRCPETNERVASEVWILADLYDGPFADELPDLVVEWQRSRPLRSMCSERIGTVSIPVVNGRTGDHKAAGLFIATGRGLGARRLDRPVAIVDFAPTFLAWFGIPAPEPLAGKPIPELLAIGGEPAGAGPRG